MKIPVLLYFNISKQPVQQTAFDFGTVAHQYSVNIVEPPQLVQTGPNKVYAVTRASTFKTKMLLITQVILNPDGSPTGSYEFVPNGIMPLPIFESLFRTVRVDGMPTREITPPPWEVVCGNGYVGVKVCTWDPVIALFNVDDQNWNCTSFPYIRDHGIDVNNSVSWQFVQGTYEPSWLAIP